MGLHSRSNDLTVNPAKEKKLTNVRASGSDEAIDLNAPVKMSLEQSLEFIDEDEFVEVTPSAIRIRKKLLKEYGRDKTIILTPERDAITAVGREIASECWLLCFDEFQVILCDVHRLY